MRIDFFNVTEKNRRRKRRRRIILFGLLTVLVIVLLTLILSQTKESSEKIEQNKYESKVSTENPKKVEEEVEDKKEEKKEGNIVPEKDEQLDKVRKLVKNDKTGLTELINKDNASKFKVNKADLRVPNINLVAEKSADKNLLRKEAAVALEEMVNAAKKEHNFSIFLNSGYRSEERQQEVYAAKIEKSGETENDYVALPGHSEHQTGLAADLTCKEARFRLEEKFEKTKEGQWAIENAHKYGFILRYPKGKEKITGYSYEPWHYRYVGKELSMYLKEKNMALEEFYTQIND